MDDNIDLLKKRILAGVDALLELLDIQRPELKKKTKKPTTIPANVSVPDDLKGLKLYEDDKKLCFKWEDLKEMWELAFPNVDIVYETRKAHAWENSNKGRKKKDHAKFLYNWFTRAENNAERKAARGGLYSPRPDYNLDVQETLRQAGKTF